MLSAEDELRPFEVVVYAREGRQFTEGLELVRDKRHDLPEQIVIHLGTNGYINDLGMAELGDLLRNHRVYILSLYADREWTARNNRLIKGFARAYKNWHLVKWRQLAKANTEWFTDGVHPNAEGQRAYAALIGEAIKGP